MTAGAQDARMDALLRDYLRSMQARRLSPESIRTAQSVLKILTRTTGKPLHRITPDDIADWQAQRAGEVTARTLRKNVSAVRTCFAWAAAEERIEANPTVRMRTPKTPRLLPRPIPEERLADAMAAGNDRMRAILGLAAYAGLRAGEIASLSWSEVALDVASPVMRVTGKGSAERMLDISPELARLLVALPHRRGPVIRRADGLPGHNSANRISQVGNDHLRCLNIPDTLHSLRHLCLTEACRVGGLRVAQEIAGHASSSTTAHYTKVARTDLREVMHEVARRLAS